MKTVPAVPGPVLVTGAGGFIGSQLCRLLTEQDVRFVGILGPQRAVPNATPLGTFIHVNLADAAAVRNIVDSVKPRRILNLAAVGTAPGAVSDLEQYLKVNVQLPMLLYEAMGPDCTLVQVGSMSQYRGASEPLNEDAAARDYSTLYSWSKNAADVGLQTLSEGSPTPTKSCVRVRVFGVIGPGEASHRLLPTIVAACRARTDVLLSDGEQVRDVMHVDDVVSALLAVSTHTQLSGQAVNIGRGEGRSVRWMAERAVSRLGCRSALKFGARSRRPGEADSLIAEVRRLAAIGWRPTLSLEESIDRALLQMSRDS